MNPNVKLAKRIQNLVGQCLITDVYSSTTAHISSNQYLLQSTVTIPTTRDSDHQVGNNKLPRIILLHTFVYGILCNVYKTSSSIYQI